MNLKDYFNDIDIKEINRIIDEKQEENISLEFKTVNHPNYNNQNREFDKKNISEILSGFANSNGGIVIWGIKAKENEKGQDIAKEKKPIKELTKFLNTLNRLEGQAVTPIIEGVIHEKIEISDDLGFVKSFVPKSSSAPHMANFAGKHYYKRSGDSFYQCEHFDIADMFSRKKQPKLRFHFRKLPQGWSYVSGRKFIKYCFAISIHNEGNNIAKFPFLGLSVVNAYPERFGIDGNGNRGLTKTVSTPLYKHNYIGGSDKVIYPQTMIDVDHYFVNVEEGADISDIEIEYLISAENMDNVYGKLTLSEKDFNFKN